MMSMVSLTGKGDKPTLRRAWPWALFIGLLGLAVFGLGVASEPHFADESAYISQSYYYDLFWVQGNRTDKSWLEYPAVDLPPLAKYLIGAALHLAGHRRPDDPMAWYFDIHRRPESASMLLAARVPAVILGALGCVATFALGTVAGDRRVGLIAACFVMANPLYRLSAHRAMADMPAQAMVLATAALALWAWRGVLSGRWGALAAITGGVGTGCCGGLAVLAKLNGTLGLMTAGAWIVLAAALPNVPVHRKRLISLAFAVTVVVAFGTFVSLNPFMTAPPDPTRGAGRIQIAGTSLWDRASIIVRNRVSVTRDQVSRFRETIRWWPERPLVVAIQGFGRFGLFGPLHHDSQLPYDRYDWGRDWGESIWLPWVVIGAIWAALRGREQYERREPPTAWALLIQAALSVGVVGTLLPLAWDRYFLDFQPATALLAAGVAVEAADHLLRRRAS
jgi:4-amino-4-deoxy-L-arabinose transferase-like glycosyltransferase